MTGKKKHPEPTALKILVESLELSSPSTSQLARGNLDPRRHQAACSRRRHEILLPPQPARPQVRSRLTNTIGIIAPELSKGYFTSVILGVEQYLLQEGFLYFTVSHLGQSDL